MKRLIDTNELRAAGFTDAADAIEAQARAEAESRMKMVASPKDRRPIRAVQVVDAQGRTRGVTEVIL